MDLANRLRAAVDAGWERELAFLTALVRTPSTRGREAAAQEVVFGELRRLALAPERVQVRDEELRGRPGHSPVDWDYGGPNVVAALPGSGGGRSLTLNGHIDVVPATPEHHWTRAPWGAEVHDGRMYGRGAADMKAGVAAMIGAVAALRAAGVTLRGDLRLETVIEEECSGNGALACRVRGPRTDAALIPEPFGHTALEAQLGVLWARVTLRGAAAHAERADQAVNAALKAQPVLAAIAALEAEVNAEPRSRWFAAHPHPLNYNVGSLQAGDWASSVPEECVLGVRLAAHPGADLAAVMERFERAVASTGDGWLAAHPPRVQWLGFRAEGFGIERDEPLLAALGAAHAAVHGAPLEHLAFTGTTDARFFVVHDATPATCYGPVGGNLHAPDEWVDLESVRATTLVLALAAAEWCGVTA